MCTAWHGMACCVGARHGMLFAWHGRRPSCCAAMGCHDDQLYPIVAQSCHLTNFLHGSLPSPMLTMPQGLWPAMCLDPPAASQTVAAAIEAGGAAARAAAEAATVGARQCCGSTLVTLSRALGRLGIQRAAVYHDGNLGGQGVGRHAAGGHALLHHAKPCAMQHHATPMPLSNVAATRRHSSSFRPASRLPCPQRRQPPPPPSSRRWAMSSRAPASPCPPVLLPWGWTKSLASPTPLHMWVCCAAVLF